MDSRTARYRTIIETIYQEYIDVMGEEEGIAYELEAAGIPKHHIVLAFKPLSNRQIIPDYAIS